MGLMISFLGTGSDYPTKFKEPTCLYIKALYGEGHVNVLFDCPPMILRQLDKANISPKKLMQ